MPFYVRLGPSSFLIAAGAVLHSRIGKAIYLRKKRRRRIDQQKNGVVRPLNARVDQGENLTPRAPFVQIIRSQQTLPKSDSVIQQGQLPSE